MPIARRRRAVPELEPEPAQTPQEELTIQPGDGEIDPDLPQQMRFFSALRRIPPDEWSNHRVYLYRLEPRVRNSGPHSNIGIMQEPFDEEDIRELHGGGKYQAILKNTELDKAVSKCTIGIEGPPKILKGQTLLDESGHQILTAPPATLQVNPSPAVTENAIAEIIRVIQQQKMPAEDAIKQVMETMSAAQKGALDLVMNAAKTQAASTTGHPMMDKLVERTLEKMVSGDDTAKRNPMEEMKTMLQTMKELQGLTGEVQPRPRGGVLEEVKAVAELLKTDSDGSMKTLIFGRDEPEPPSGWSQFFGFLGKALERRPDIIDHVANGLGKLAGSIATAPRTITAPAPVTIQGTASLSGADGAPVATPPMSTAAAPTQPATESASPEQAQGGQVSESSVVEGILAAVANGYRHNYSGAAVANSIKVLYPQAVDLMRKYLDYPDVLVIGYLKNQPIMAPIAADEEFPEFLAEFKAALLADDVQDEDEPEDQQEQGTAAG